MYTRPCFLFLFFSLLFCLLHVIPYWSGVIIILEKKDGMYLVAAPRLAWFQGFIACVTFLYVHLWSMLCYDYYYVLLFGMVILLRSPLPGCSLLLSFVILVPGFHFWCLEEKSGLIYRCLAFCKKFFLLLVGIVSLLFFCPLQIFNILETMCVPR